MGNEEEEKEKEVEEEKSVVHFCPMHKKVMTDSFAEGGMRTLVQITQATFFSVYMMGKGFTTEEEVATELEGKCPNCYWDKALDVAVNYLCQLGYPVSLDQIKRTVIEEPSPSIWKN